MANCTPENDVKTRLELYIKHKHMNNLQFCKSIGVSPAYISSIRKSITPEKLVIIAETFPDLNLTWLMTGYGEMLVAKLETPNVTSITAPSIVNGSYNELHAEQTSKDADAFWKDLVTQLREDVKYWKSRCEAAEARMARKEIEE